MLFPLLLFAVIVLTVCTLLGLLMSISFLFKPSKQITLTERLQFQKLAGITLIGVTACVAGLFAAYEISTGLFIALTVDLVLLSIQLIIYRFKWAKKLERALPLEFLIFVTKNIISLNSVFFSFYIVCM